MTILFGSQNPSKKKSLELALSELEIENTKIITYDAPQEFLIDQLVMK